MHTVAKLAVLVALLVLAGCRRPAPQALPTSPALPATPAPFAAPVTTGGADIPDLVARVKPGVVNITTTQEVRQPSGYGMPFGFFFGPQGRSGPGDRVTKRTSLGTGFIVDAAGHVVTNAHVVEGADEVKVRLSDERELSAVVKGRDTKLDVAVLEIEGASGLPAESIGSSENLRVGESVVAIGNPFGLGFTVTMGIVSAKSRTIGAGPYDDFIQTDASINPGNSGGPLFDLRGQVVGINTAIKANGQGIGFAIPIDDVKEVIPQLLRTGRVARGRLGVSIQNVDSPMAKALGLDRARGALVADVEARGPSAKAGIKPGDVIVRVDKTPIGSANDLPRVVASHEPGTVVQVTFVRDKTERTMEVTLDALRQADADRPGQAGPTGERTRGLGIAIIDTPDGVVVTEVASDGPAEGSLRSGDVIAEVNRVPVVRTGDVVAQIERVPVGQAVLMKILREGSSRFVAVERK
jgi:serine protease Do